MEDASGNHYKKFEDLLGHVTDEKDRPSSRGQTTAAVAQELQIFLMNSDARTVFLLPKMSGVQ